MQQKASLIALARQHLKAAQSDGNGRSAKTLFGGHEHGLRQTLIALLAGQELGEHNNPDEATVQVLHGRVSLIEGSVSWEGSAGDLIIVPEKVHRLRALDDCVVLLTIAKYGRVGDTRGPQPGTDA
jgi:quercetin dioxygenase-like cupin family protein